MYADFFKNIPINETFELALDFISSNNHGVKMYRKDLKKLFQFPTPGTHFYFNGVNYEHVDGVVICPPLSPVLAISILGHHEQHLLISFILKKIC